MIAKGKAVSHGRTVIEYVLREKKLGSFVEKNLLTSETADEILQEMKWTQAYNSRCKNKFLRFEIGIAPDDKDKLTKLQLQAIVMSFAKKMGLEKHQWLAVTHKDTDNLHIHLIANRIGINGKVYQTDFVSNRASRTAEEISREMGLTIANQVVAKKRYQHPKAEEKILTERRLSNVHTFDAMPCLGTTINDLDVKLIKKEFLPKAVAEEILAEDKRGIEEQLASLGFYDLRYNCPTNGAIVLFGINPERYLHGSYVQYVRFKGFDRAGDIINEHKFAGNICRELPKIDTFIETSISQKRPIPVSVLREETVSKYPYWATRELLMNAIMHRDYETNAPVLFYEYDDRIEIQNPGGLYGKVSPANFPNVSDYRNPFIAEAMKVLGYVNRFSRGVYRVQKELVENGNGKAEFDFSLITAFRVVENVSEKYFEEGFGENPTQETLEKKPKKNPEKAKEKPKKKPKKD